jgi:hypothetical protein
MLPPAKQPFPRNSFIGIAALTRHFRPDTLVINDSEAQTPAARGRTVRTGNSGAYVNTNRKLPRAQMLKAHRAEQRSRRGSL